MEKKIKNKKIKKYICGLFTVNKTYIIKVSICLVFMAFLSFFQPLVIRKITDQGMMEKNMSSILLYVVLLVVVCVLYQSFDIIQTRIFSNIYNSIVFYLYKQAYWKMNGLKIDYYCEHSSEEILQMINNDIMYIASVANQITVHTLTVLLQVMGGVIGLALLNNKLVILILGIIPLKLIVVHVFSKKKHLLSEQLINSKRVFSGWLGDCINGIREMKLWGLFYEKYVDFEKLQFSIMTLYRKSCLLDKYKQASISLLDIAMTAVIYIISGWMIVEGKFTIGSAFAFITYTGYVISPISYLADIKYYYAEIKPCAKRFFDFLELSEEQMNLKRSIFNEKPKENLYKDGEVVRNNDIKIPVLELSGVKYGYESDRLILNNIDLKVWEGERIAIVGDNGCGKTTLLNLLAGFYYPDAGTVKIEGIPIEKLGLDGVRKKISMICQFPHIFNATIQENVNIDGSASYEDVYTSCEKSGVIEFLKNSGRNLEQLVGKDGAKLSGGERQKLAFARALVKKSDILILDEATSSLDQEANRKIFEMLYKENIWKSIIFVTHKVEELESVDKVYELSKGKLRLVK